MQPEIQVVASLNGKRNRNSFVHDHLNIPTAEIKRLIQMFLKKKRLIQLQLEIQVVASWNRKRNQNSSKQECLATVSSVGGLTPTVHDTKLEELRTGRPGCGPCLLWKILEVA
jgi:hypothetical protein